MSSCLTLRWRQHHRKNQEKKSPHTHVRSTLSRQSAHNMSVRRGRVDKRIAKAAAFKMRCQDALIPAVMYASKFTLAESSNPVKQMVIRRAYEKAIGSKTKAPATVSSSLLTLSRSPRRTKSTAKTAGTQQTPDERHDDAEIQLRPHVRQIRNTASGMQKWRVNKFDLSDHNKRVFKRATSWYDRELQKVSAGLSLYDQA